MQRVNVHLPRDMIRELDAIAEKVKVGEYWATQFNRANLIRYAISKTFNLQGGYFGPLERKLEELKPKKKKK